MTPPQIADKLKTAGLLAVAERVAKRHDLLVKHVLEIVAEPTQGHVALWMALAKEGQSSAQIASLLGWPEAVIRCTLQVPEARPTPAPESEPRVKPTSKRAPRKPRARKPLAPGVVLVAPEVLPEIPDLDTGDIVPRAPRWGGGCEEPPPPVFLYPDRFGVAGDIVRTVAREHGVSMADFATAHTRAVSGARTAAVARLTTELRWSQPEIGRLLGLDPSSVYHHQQASGVRAAFAQHTRKAAA